MRKKLGRLVWPIILICICIGICSLFISHSNGDNEKEQSHYYVEKQTLTESESLNKDLNISPKETFLPESPSTEDTEIHMESDRADYIPSESISGDKPEMQQPEESSIQSKTDNIVITSAKGGISSSKEIPTFSGEPFVTLNGNIPNFSQSEITTTPFEIYSELDSLGRCGPAFANVCKDIMPTEPRGTIGMVKPSGWHTVRYDDIVDGKYLYNRCHLIGYQLSGENANVKNLITGTRWLNIVGMLSFENQVEAYVSETNNHVLYRSTPVYEGNNLVASGVQLEAFSVEDLGAGVCFNVYIYNVQPGIIIDYATGDSKADNSVLQNDGTTNTNDNNRTLPDTSESDAPTEIQVPDGVTFVLNTNSKKFHIPSCSSVADMKEKNKELFYGSREDAIAQGYSPCGRCHP